MKGSGQNARLYRFVGIGLEIVALLLLGVWLGGWLDSKFSGKGLWTGVGVISALVFWVVHVVVMVRSLNDPN